jgi:hypothetical protein
VRLMAQHNATYPHAVPSRNRDVAMTEDEARGQRHIHREMIRGVLMMPTGCVSVGSLTPLIGAMAISLAVHEEDFA